MTTTWWFGITNEYSDLCGEEFFVEVEVPLSDAKALAKQIAKENFPDEDITCFGRVSATEAEMMGLDTY